MDPLLFKAARDGNIESLHKLLEDDPLLLDRIATTTADTPLHIAAMLGHLDFVKVLIRRKTNVIAYVKELNQQGFSPIHMASANGHVDIVRELLQFSTELCCLKGKDGMTPLHCASIKGRAEIVTQLLEASVHTVSEVTVRSETALHLAVKNNQIGALESLVELERLRQNNLLEILNVKDNEGNSVLYLAVARRNHQALELLLKCNNLIPGVLQVNAINESGLTALDLVQLCPCDSSYEDIERLLKHAGAERARFLNDTITLAPQNTQINQVPTQPVSPALATNESPSIPEQMSRDEILDWEDYFKFQFDKSKPDEVRNGLLVVAVLMATATFQAGLSPPGGISGDGPKKGEAHLASDPSLFICFMFFNSAGFFVSLTTIGVLTNNFPMFNELSVAICAMTVTYDSAMISISPPGRIRTLFWILSIAMPISIPSASHYIRKRYKKRSGPLAYRRHQSA